MTTETEAPLPKLAITCTSSACDEDLHCFRSTKKLVESGLAGACRHCHVQLVDWPRVHKRLIGDADHTFGELRLELIRHHFWHLEIDEAARNHALRKGRIALGVALAKRLASSVGPEVPFRDGRQTPMSGNVIYYAQHATASCCRTCIEYWHGIQKGRPLTAEELIYLTDLATMFIAERLPDLPDGPSKVPLLRGGDDDGDQD
jgi:hypothetical protein